MNQIHVTCTWTPHASVKECSLLRLMCTRRHSERRLSFAHFLLAQSAWANKSDFEAIAKATRRGEPKRFAKLFSIQISRQIFWMSSVVSVWRLWIWLYGILSFREYVLGKISKTDSITWCRHTHTHRQTLELVQSDQFDGVRLNFYRLESFE